MKPVMVAALVLLCLACGPAPPPDARDFVPEAIPPGGPQPWEKGTKKPTKPTTTATALPTAAPVPAATPAAPLSADVALTAGELKAKVLAWMREGVSEDLILAYVSRQTLSGKMTVDDILDWKQAGIADAVIKAAAAR